MLTRTPRLFVLEDDHTVREAVEVALESEGYAVASARVAEEAWANWDGFAPDLAVVDIRLPGQDGLSFVKDIRTRTNVPVIFLTAADTLDDRVAGFEAGADDYIVKPFEMKELLLRVRALLTRVGLVGGTSWVVGDLEIDGDTRQVKRGRREIHLTPQEFDLLCLLADRADSVVSREEIASALWGGKPPEGNVIDVRISTLRKKLEAHGGRLIHTVYGTGYTMHA